MADSIMEPFDPAFSSQDADTVLCSSDGTSYRIYAHTLTTASDFFRTMLTLPQDSQSQLNHITMDESTKVLGTLFRMIHGLEISKWESFDDLVNVLNAAHKYDMPGPITTIRLMIMSPLFLSEPLRLYEIATRFGWEEEAKLASEKTLTLNINAVEHEPVLKTLSAEYLLKLLKLHQNRKDEFRSLMSSVDRFSVGNTYPYICGVCSCTTDHHFWNNLKLVMCSAMDRRPKRDTILGSPFEDKEEAVACWGAKCQGCVDRPLYAKSDTLRMIEQSLQQLPSTI